MEKWCTVKERKLGKARAEEIAVEARVKVLEMELAELRRETGVTQTELAARTGMEQSELSRFERRDDRLLSTLKRYVESLGCELEVWAVGHGRRVKLHV